MTKQEQQKLTHKSAQEESILEPRSIQSQYEMLASRHIIGEYRDTLQMYLKEFRGFDDQFIESFLEEWHYIALCLDRAPEAKDDLSHADLLDEIRGFWVPPELPKDATWNDIIVSAMSDFDGLIETGIACKWPWEKVLQVYNGNRLIASALEAGVHPDVSLAGLVEIVAQQASESVKEWAQFEADRAKTREK